MNRGYKDYLSRSGSATRSWRAALMSIHEESFNSNRRGDSLGSDTTPGFPHDPLLTPEQVAERLNVSPDWVRDHSSRKTPRLPVIRLGGGLGRAGLLRYRASDIEKFIDEMARLSEPKLRARYN